MLTKRVILVSPNFNFCLHLFGFDLMLVWHYEINLCLIAPLLVTDIKIVFKWKFVNIFASLFKRESGLIC